MRGVITDAPIVPIPAKFPDAVLDFAVDIPDAIDPAIDFPASASLRCAPSGAGEMQISGLTVINNQLTYTASGGQPGRRYRLKFVVPMTDRRTFTWVGEQPITPVLSTDQAQPIPSPDFGTAIYWTFVPCMMDFTNIQNSGYAAVIAGF